MNAVLIELVLGVRNLRRNVKRSLAALATVASGVVAFMLAGGFIAWTLVQGREGAIHSQLGHVQIVRPGFFDRGIANPYGFLLPSEDTGLAIFQRPDVVAVTPRLLFNGLISHGETTVAFSGEGIDPLKERPIASAMTILTGHDLGGLDERQALLGEGLARSLAVAPGDRVVLMTTASGGGPSAIEVEVAGTFMSVAKEYDDYAVRLPIPLARKVMRVSGATSWVVLLTDTERTANFVQAANSALSSKEFQVVPWRELADFFNKTEALFTKQVTVVKVIIGMIILLTIANTLTMSVLERTAEIGTSLAVGVPKAAVMRQHVLEGALIGIIGGLVGVALGSMLGFVISTIGIPMPPPPGMAHGFVAKISITPSLAFEAMVLAIFPTVVASVIPAWKASRMNIIEALRVGQ
ncbi:MAG: ABC transporter permease [Rhodocyclaceae bacterium]|nr:ABC transporter permease [Rhodocyclaceae bacterium]MBK6552369.1 ABC transporter permease [Rhodocyclaceae bacterium]MBK6675697.1 ABC transporter permease [Rhodocyclaceae bacterium]MBK7814125.1 ABC transporter permease [Rhodocyclaceae bacterium]MBK9311906.1 ABC transporter permease [Rhodocyclaceae bacterium]